MQKYLGRHCEKKTLNFLIKMVLLLATGSIMAILVFTCPFGEKSIINKWKIKKRNDQDEKGIPKTTFAANALTFTA